MKEKGKIEIYVGKRNSDDPLAFTFFTEENETFISDSGPVNISKFMEKFNILRVRGDSDYVATYLANWLINVSNKIVNSNVFRLKDGYGVSSVVMPRTIQFVSNYKSRKSLKEMIMKLFMVNDNTKIIKLSNKDEYVLENDAGKVVVGDNIISLNYSKAIKNKKINNP